jgi:hypothetical protein
MPIIRSSGPIDKVISVTKAVVKHISSDLPFLSLEDKQERLVFCIGDEEKGIEKCECYNRGWCDTEKGGCGCNVFAKVAFPLEKCPKDKWGIHPKAQAIIDEHTKDTDVKIGECQNCPKQ